MSDSINRDNRAFEAYRWSLNPVIIGKRISLSNSNSKRVKTLRCDLCQLMAGSYPSYFIWHGWHDECLCFTTPILMKREYLDRYNKLIATGRDTLENIEQLRIEADSILNTPEGFRDWIFENVRSHEAFETAPYWIKENYLSFDQLKSLL